MSYFVISSTRRLVWHLVLIVVVLLNRPSMAQLASPQAPSSPIPSNTEIKYELPKQPVRVPDSLLGYKLQDAQADEFLQIVAARSLKPECPNGKGLAVVVIDTGVNSDHIAFQGQILPGRNFSDDGDPNDTQDYDGHGSRVAGLIAALEVDPRNLPAGLEIPPGVAYGARIVPLKILHDRHKVQAALGQRMNEALRWIIDNREDIIRRHGVVIGVVNISISLDNMTSPDDVNGPRFREQDRKMLKEQQRLIAELRQAGVVVVAAAGNAYQKWGCIQGMGFPAICPETVSVGAVFDKDRDYGVNGYTFDDGSTVFKARMGRCTPFTHRLGKKGGTDIFAPGVDIYSTGGFVKDDAKRSRFGIEMQDGTSFAAPITGGVALLVQHMFLKITIKFNHSMQLPSVDFVEECLRQGGVEFVDSEEPPGAERLDNVQSCGETFYRLHALRACQYVQKRYLEDRDLWISGQRERIPGAVYTILGLPVPQAGK